MRKTHFIAAMALTVLMVSCDREPEDPYDRFVYQFEKKVDVLLDHIRNADEVMEGEGFTPADGRQARIEVKYYRYKHIGPAALGVVEHFTQPNMAFYLEISHAERVDGDWLTRLKESYEQASKKLAIETERFRNDMPRFPPIPEQSSKAGQSVASAFRPGGIFGSSSWARAGFYRYDDDDVLWFYVEDGSIQLEKLFSLDIDAWVDSISRAPPNEQSVPRDP